MNTNTETTVDIDSLLDSTLDDLADMPTFKNYPIGAHKVFMSLTEKTLGEGATAKKGVQADFAYIEVLELTNPDDVAPAPKDTCNIFCDLSNEFGQGTLKMILTAIKSAFPEAKSNREIIAQAKNVEVGIVTGLRADKVDKTRKYLQLQNVSLM